MVRADERVVMFAINMLNFLESLMVATENSINRRIKQALPKEVMVCLMTYVYIQKLESANEILENVASGLVLDIHI